MTEIHEEVTYCSPSTSSGKQKKNRSTSQPQFRSENTPATIEADQMLFVVSNFHGLPTQLLETWEEPNCWSRLNLTFHLDLSFLRNEFCTVLHQVQLLLSVGSIDIERFFRSTFHVCWPFCGRKMCSSDALPDTLPSWYVTWTSASLAAADCSSKRLFKEPRQEYLNLGFQFIYLNFSLAFWEFNTEKKTKLEQRALN